MEPQVVRARDRRCLSAAVPLVHVAWRACSGASAAALDYFRTRRIAGSSRLVDGGLRTFAARGSFPISPGYASGVGASDLRSDPMDSAAPIRTTATHVVVAVENH